MQRLGYPLESIWVKAPIIGGLTLLMLWPLARVGSLVSERQELQHQAYSVISAGFGGPQTIGGPILSVDTQDLFADLSGNSSLEVWRPGASIHLLSDKLQIESDSSGGAQNIRSLLQVVPHRGKRWTKIGAAFPHKEGPGFSIELSAIPLDGSLVILPPDGNDDNRGK